GHPVDCSSLVTETSLTSDRRCATLPAMATRTRSRTKTSTTPWGAARTVEQLSLPQRAGEKRFATVIQLLETDKGERLVRFAYTTGGVARRGPVTLRVRDLERLRAALAEHPRSEEHTSELQSPDHHVCRIL